MFTFCDVIKIKPNRKRKQILENAQYWPQIIFQRPRPPFRPDDGFVIVFTLKRLLYS